MKKAFFAGSFDPFTIAHLSVVCKALSDYDQIIIGVGNNSDKMHKFSVSDRVKMVEKSIEDLVEIFDFYGPYVQFYSANWYAASKKIKSNPDCVKVLAYDGLTVDAAVKSGAQVLLRGRRNHDDRTYEIHLRYFNDKICRLRGVVCPTVFERDPILSQVSSTMVRNLMAQGEYILAKEYVMPSVHDIMCKEYLRDVYLNLTGDKKMYEYLCKKSEEGGFHRFGGIACDLNMLNIYRMHNPSHDMSSKFYDMVLFFSPLVNKEVVSKEIFDAIGNVTGGNSEQLVKFIELCEATKIALYANGQNDRDADALSDICLTPLLSDGSYLVNLWQRRKVAELNGLSEFDFLSALKDYHERYSMNASLLKTEYFREKYGKTAEEFVRREIGVLGKLLDKHKKS